MPAPREPVAILSDVHGNLEALTAVIDDIRGQKDIFGRPMKVAQVDVVDGLTGMAVLLMGEGAEQKPIVVLRGFQGIKFNAKASMQDFKISPEDDLYGPLLAVMKK